MPLSLNVKLKPVFGLRHLRFIKPADPNPITCPTTSAAIQHNILTPIFALIID